MKGLNGGQLRLHTIEATGNEQPRETGVKKAKLRKFMKKQKRENKWKEQKEKKEMITQTVKMQENLFKLNQFVESQRRNLGGTSTIDVRASGTLKK